LDIGYNKLADIRITLSASIFVSDSASKSVGCKKNASEFAWDVDSNADI